VSNPGRKYLSKLVSKGKANPTEKKERTYVLNVTDLKIRLMSLKAVL
jgi:hypothetical protein